MREKLGIDTVFLPYPVDTNGCRINRLQKFVGNDGSEAWIGADNKWDVLDDGFIVMYPMGDKSVAPSTIMIPKGTYFSNQVLLLSTADYGAQSGPIISSDLFRDVYKPYYKKLNDWIHQNTNWKVMYHCCSGIIDLLDDYADMGCDILNPIQVSAAGMDPKTLKERWGDKLVFWGGGADAQGCLTFGTPEEMAAQATERMEIFSPGGGFVFNPVHNIMPETKHFRI